MIRQLTLASVGVVLLTSSTGCFDSTPRNVSANPAVGGGAEEPKEIGGPLYAPKPLPPATPPAGFTTDPVLVPAHLTIVDKVDIPSQRDGKILFIGTEVKPGDPVGAKLYKHREKTYRALAPNEPVEAGQVVMLLDDAEAWAELEARKAALSSATEVMNKAADVLTSTRKIYETKYELNQKGQLSLLELITALIELKRAEATETNAKAEVVKARSDVTKAQVAYDYYFIRTNITGTLQPFNRKPGEAVKALETVLQVQGVDVLRAEGQIPTGYANRLTRLMPVTIEPIIEEAPKVRRRFHTQAVTGVAVTAKGTAYIVSVSEDKTARVWDGRSDYETAIFSHPVGVRAVACSPAGSARVYCITGADDGKIRLWDLTTPKSSATPLREFEGFAHMGAVSAISFSPDGKLCASADSRDIALWDVETGKLRYRFPQAHLGEITSLTFTPQAKMVSASRDMTVRVWSLGETGARLDFTQEGRTGDVGRLGVSGDGRYFLFDISQTLRLITLTDRRTEGVLESANDSYKFASFAIFSHDGKTILTGTQNESRLSVWRTPMAGTRATELRQFIPRERLVTFTCAAVSSDEANPLAVTGTKSGETYVWPMPTERDVVKLNGTLKFIDQNAAASSRQLRIWAEFENTGGKLRPGGTVTLVLEPAAK